MKGINHSRWFGWLSLVIVLGYFVVGLWPFDFHPLNRVSWLPIRVSATMDLLTNTTGALLGAALALVILRQLTKAGSASKIR